MILAVALSHIRLKGNAKHDTIRMANPKYDYVITLKEPSYRWVDGISQILLVLFLLPFLYYLLQTGINGQNAWLLVIPAIIIGLWLYGYVRRAEPEFQVYYRVELLVSALGWFFLPLPFSKYIGWAYALLAFVERYVKFPDEIGFSAEGVVRNTFPRKTYQWYEIDNVVLRDNLFTLDLRNNRVIQKELDIAVDKKTEQEFNEFCTRQLHFKVVSG
jgi:hypothetical protein